jgi:hypothetical protein
VKIFLTFIVVIGLVVVAVGLSKNDNQEQRIDDWAKQSALLFQDTATFLSSLKSDIPAEVDAIDEKIQTLLPNKSIDLRYEPDLNESINLANDQPINVGPNALLPNLFGAKQKSGTSLKGQIFTDEEDKIIGAEVQLAIPTDM